MPNSGGDWLWTWDLRLGERLGERWAGCQILVAIRCKLGTAPNQHRTAYPRRIPTASVRDERKPISVSPILLRVVINSYLPPPYITIPPNSLSIHPSPPNNTRPQISRTRTMLVPSTHKLVRQALAATEVLPRATTNRRVIIVIVC